MQTTFSRAPSQQLTRPPRTSVSKPPFLLPFALLLLLAFGLGHNTPLALFAVAVLTFGGFALWRPGEPPILLFIFGYQWLQASIAIFYANALGVPLAQLPGSLSSSATTATLLSLAALAAMAAGLRLGAGPPRPHLVARAQATLARVPFRRWLKFYISLWLFSTGAQFAAKLIPGLSQIFLVLGNLKWGGYLILTMATFGGGGVSRLAWAAASGAEFVLSLGGIYSSFKIVFFYMLIALATARLRLTPSRVFVGAIGAVCLLGLGVVWSEIKTEYRSFVSGGGSEQVVLVGFSERISELGRLVSNLDEHELVDGVDKLIARISYVQIFGSVLETVPNVVPFEGGKLWFDALSRPFMPRLFFPEKAVLDDFAVTNKYSGLHFAGAAQGTSVSIGYIGETYIDFGELFMFPILFLYWMLMGWFYKFMTSGANIDPLIGMAFVTPVFMECAYLETALPKMVGAVAVYILVSWLIIKYVAPRYFRLFIQ